MKTESMERLALSFDHVPGTYMLLHRDIFGERILFAQVALTQYLITYVMLSLFLVVHRKNVR